MEVCSKALSLAAYQHLQERNYLEKVSRRLDERASESERQQQQLQVQSRQEVDGAVARSARPRLCSPASVVAQRSRRS